MIRAAAFVTTLACLSGCSHKAGSIVGTWRREPEVGAMYPNSLEWFSTYNADGTLHSEAYFADGREPNLHNRGTYKLVGSQLTSEIQPYPGRYGRQTGTIKITLSGDTMTIAGDTMPWRRLNYAYRFEDPGLVVVGRWKDERGQTLELNADGTFSENIATNKANGGASKGSLYGNLRIWRRQ